MRITQFILPILLAAGMLLLAIFIIVASKNHKEDKGIEPNYMAFFILGICLFPMGILLWMGMDNPGFLGIAGLGFVYLIVSLTHNR